MTRQEKIKNSDGLKKNPCAYAVASALSVENSVRYLNTTADVVRAAKKRFTVKRLADGMKVKNLKVDGLYIVTVNGHIMLMANGKIIVDTNKDKKDNMVVECLHEITKRG